MTNDQIDAMFNALADIEDAYTRGEISAEEMQSRSRLAVRDAMAAAEPDGDALFIAYQLGFERGKKSAAPAEPTAEARDAANIKNLKQAGRMLANIAFNLAQREPATLTKAEVKTLTECRKAWDAAMSTPPQEPAPKGGA